MLKPAHLIIALSFVFILFGSMRAHAQNTTNPPSAASAWTPEIEKELYTTLYDASKQLLKEDAQRQEWANCSVQKLKTALPNGLESVPQDSLSKLANQAGAGCTLSLKNAVFLWSPMMVTKIKANIAARPEFQKFKSPAKEQLIDCLLTKFQQQHPDGFSESILAADAEKIAKSCIAGISPKKP